MELETRLAELAKMAGEHREVLLTEQAAKTALVMPFLQALGYNVFNPSEVVPEFTCDVGIKKGEKVDYAICSGDNVMMLIECKPASAELNISNASQLFRYFSTTDTRIAILTNGIVYKFFTDVDSPNKMDNRPFFTMQIDALRKPDIRILERFTKASFDIDKIVEEAANLKIQSLVYRELQKEFQDPSEELVRMIATRIHHGRFTPAVRDAFKGLIIASVSSLIRDRVTERLTSALSASNPGDDDESDDGSQGPILTTEEELTGFNIVRAIGSKVVDPRRIILRDAKSYCAVLLDDNNRKPIVRMHFNSPTTKYVGTFAGKEETRHPISDPVELYQHGDAIVAQLKRLAESKSEPEG